MKRLTVVLCVAVAACSSSDDGSLFIEEVGSLTDTCEIEADPSQIRASGLFDPTVANSFLFTPVVVNSLTVSEQSSQGFFESDTVIADANAVRLLGFDVCYARSDDERLRRFGSFSEGFPLDCEADGLLGEFISSIGTISPGGQASLSVSVLSAAIRQELLGSLSGSVGAFVIARAVGKRTNGDPIQSDFFAYQVSFAPGYVVSQCPGPDREVDFEASCFPGSGFGVACKDVEDPEEATP